MSSASDQIANNRHFSLLELLDRLLDKGVMVKGEILLAVADVDLVYLNLGLLLSSVKTVEQAASRGYRRETALTTWQTALEDVFFDEQPLKIDSEDASPVSFTTEQRPEESDLGEAPTEWLSSAQRDTSNVSLEPKANIDPKNVEKGLAKLVLTLVELLRKLMEQQAVRRIEAGQLQEKEIDRMGDTFLLLDEKMEQLKQIFGLQDEDLNLDLGPLGDLL